MNRVIVNGRPIALDRRKINMATVIEHWEYCVLDRDRYIMVVANIQCVSFLVKASYLELYRDVPRTYRQTDRQTDRRRVR